MRVILTADNPQLRAVVAEGVFAEVRDIETGIRLAGILSRAPFDPLVNRLVAHFLPMNSHAGGSFTRVAW
jgi:hypothetical protein